MYIHPILHKSYTNDATLDRDGTGSHGKWMLVREHPNEISCTVRYVCSVGGEGEARVVCGLFVRQNEDT